MTTKLPIDVFCRGNADEYWPQRLLHIPTMISVERQGFDTYPAGPPGSPLVKRPDYSALSYTWGRGEDRTNSPNKKRLNVGNLDWPTPPIREDFFKIEDFQRVLKVMEAEHEFVWIDIACIHQTDKDLKVYEIGQQAKIFQRESSIFIWLHQTPSQELRCVMDKAHALQDPISVPQIDRLMRMLDDARSALENLSQDLWFSSLWTVQESYCTSFRSKFVSQDASFVTWNTLEDFHEFRTETQNLRNSPEFAAKWKAFLDRIHEFGYRENAPDNPNIIRAVTGLRKASVEQDRVLAIMSLYEIVAKPGEKNPYDYSLEALEHSFAAELNKNNPTLAQWFIHTERPPAKSSWKPTVKSRIPSRVGKRPPHYDLTLHGGKTTDSATLCNITATEDGHAMFEGPVCHLDALLNPSEGGILVEVDDWLQSVYPELDYGPGPHDLSFHLDFAQTVTRVLGAENVLVLALGKNQFVYGGLLLLSLDRTKSKYQRIGLIEYEPIGLQSDKLEGNYMKGVIH